MELCGDRRGGEKANTNMRQSRPVSRVATVRIIVRMQSTSRKAHAAPHGVMELQDSDNEVKMEGEVRVDSNKIFRYERIPGRDRAR